MAKTIVSQNAVAYAPKFGDDGRRLLDRAYSGQKEMKAAPYLWTQEQIDALITAPRSKADVTNPDEWKPIAGDKFGNVTMPEGAEWHWAQVDGFAVCGTSLLNDAEKARYRAYIKARESGTVKTERKQPKDMDKWNALLEQVKNDPVAVQMVKELMPQARVPAAFKKLTGRDIIDDTVWTWHGFMYAAPDGTKNPALMSKDVGHVMAEGWEPVLLTKDIQALLEQVKNAGIKVTTDKNGTKFAL